MRHRGRSSVGRLCIVRGWALMLAVAALAACADKQVTVRYQPDPAPPLLAPEGLTIFDFADDRGTEGDHDVFRVGGVYVGVWTRLVKVMTDTPWPRSLSHALAGGFAARAVPVSVANRPFTPGIAFSTPLALAGSIQNFSTEFRFGTAAHISGVVRVYDQQGAILVEKRVSDRQRWAIEKGAGTSDEALQATLNRALAEFVSKVVNDPDIDRALTRQR